MRLFITSVLWNLLKLNLCSVGFEEAEDKLLLPLDANIRTVEKFRDAVVNIEKKVEAR